MAPVSLSILIDSTEVTSKSYTVEDRHDDDTMADTTTFLTTTAMTGERESKVTAGGYRNEFHPGRAGGRGTCAGH